MDFIIDRSNLICGHDRHNKEHPRFGEGNTLMLNDHEFIYYLWQVCKQLEIPADKAMAINDADMSAPLIEEKLVELFKEYGHTISFVGEYVPSTK